MKRVCIKQNCSKRERGQNKNLAFLYYVAIKRLIVWVSLVFVFILLSAVARALAVLLIRIYVGTREFRPNS